MNGKMLKVFGVLMTLMLAVTLSGVGLLQGSQTAEAITALKWTKIPTPTADEFQLYPNSDVGPIAVTPDGGTIFACVRDEGTTEWQVYKSRNGGYTWSETGFWEDVVNAGPMDTSMIMDIHVSPNWDIDNHLFVATRNAVYRSWDRGNNFEVLGDGAHGGNIICMDVGLDRFNNWAVVIGTGDYEEYLLRGNIPDGTTDVGDVYLLVYSNWVPQNVGDGLWGVSAVLDVAFSPTYGDEGSTGYQWIFALIRGSYSRPPILVENGTMLRAATQPVTSTGDTANWGAPVQDAIFYHKGAPECVAIPNGFGLTAVHGVITFADDFVDQLSAFVGLIAYECGGLISVADSRGNVFRVDISTDIILPSTITNLNVRGNEDLGCNIFSLEVSGDALSAYIVAGLRETSTSGPSSTWQSGVHVSENGGSTWLQSFKPPSGLCFPPWASPFDQANLVWLAMAPDFGSSGIVYASTWDLFSGFWVSIDEGQSWNGRGLLDVTMDEITSIAVSPNYASDGNMFMVTNEDYKGSGTRIGLLWETKTEGTHWEVILAMNALFPMPGISLRWVELADDWPADDSIFVTGFEDAGLMAAHAPQSRVMRSADGGRTFTTVINGPSDGGVPLPPNPNTWGRSWDVVDINTIFIGDENGRVHYTDNAGLSWQFATDTAIPAGDAITDLVEMDGAILVGTENGNVYVCYDWQDDFAFERVGNGPGAANDWVSVAFDAYYGSNDIIYCGLDDWGGGGSEVWRFDLGASVWEQISDLTMTNSPEAWWAVAGVPEKWGTIHGSTNANGAMWVSSLKAGEDGTLYAIDWNNYIGWRTVEADTDTAITLGITPLFEPLWNGLKGWPCLLADYPPEDWVEFDLEVVTGSNQLFVIGQNEAGNPTLWTYYDTLTREKGPIDLVRPADAATGVGTLSTDNTQACLVLQWERAEGALKYEWEIGLDPQFTTKVAHHQFLGEEQAADDTQRFTNGEALQGCLWPGDTYYWHVRVIEPFMSPWSETWSFTTKYTSVTERPELLTPASGAADVSLTPVLTWTQAAAADSYELALAKCGDFPSSLVIDKTGGNALSDSTLSYQSPKLLEGTNYCWQVTAIKGGSEYESVVGTFTTLTEPEPEPEEGTPYWVWVVIAVSALMLIAVIVLIVLTKKP